ncbi:unnamed protein product, partial [Polarella glacialis]
PTSPGANVAADEELQQLRRCGEAILQLTGKVLAGKNGAPAGDGSQWKGDEFVAGSESGAASAFEGVFAIRSKEAKK